MDELVCDSDHGNPPGIPAPGRKIVTLSRQVMEAETIILVLIIYGFALGSSAPVLPDCTLDPEAGRTLFR